MSEGFDAADEQNRNLIAVSCEQVGVALDVNLVQCVQFGAAGPENLFFHFVTEMTAGPGVKNHLCSFGQLFLPVDLSRSRLKHNLLANAAAKDV